MSLFTQFKKSTVVTFKGKNFTLYEPSALDRTLHLQRIEKQGEESAVKFDDNGDPVLSLALVRENIESSTDLIAICMAPGIEGETIETLHADLKGNASKEFINIFYPVAESLAYDEAPADTDNPKQDPALDSVKDSL